ncbi:MAG TPA: hypothetical protein VK766_01430 [Cytophagaceae bacterium]|jgi:hypothetical protein|nr:hypothetical protein [Cytophagaceae bacterium]
MMNDTVKYLKVVLEYIIVVGFGVIIFYIDDREISDVSQTKLFIAVISFFKTLYFAFFNYRKILEASKNDMPYYEFLLFICLNVLLIIFSFSVDYTCLHWIDSTSFSEISGDLSFGRTFCEFVYFSVLTYTNFGFGQSMPISGYAKLIIIFQDVIAYAMTIFILTDFVSLKESIRENYLVKKDKHRKQPD